MDNQQRWQRWTGPEKLLAVLDVVARFERDLRGCPTRYQIAEDLGLGQVRSQVDESLTNLTQHSIFNRPGGRHDPLLACEHDDQGQECYGLTDEGRACLQAGDC